ncbi:MAG TPA: hypothetical protein VG028_02880 [Terriglobia bacterium]|nr:hypothetical protein [Terriglobia bacterium]
MSRSLARIVFFVPLVLTISQAQATAQTISPGVTLASQSLQAAVGSTTLTDATLQGTVNYTAGSDEESGTFTLEVKGNQESKLALNLSGGQRTEIRQLQAGARVDTSGVEHPMALHNCWVDASTLFPTFSVWGALNDQQVATAYIGQTVWEGATVDHLQISRVVPTESAAMTTEIQNLSAVDLYLDAGTHLPVAVTFNAHPESDLNINFPVEILFSGYQKMDGVVVATHIQKLVQGTLTFDFYVSSVAINSGIPDSAFSVQAVQGGN